MRALPTALAIGAALAAAGCATNPMAPYPPAGYPTGPYPPGPYPPGGPPIGIGSPMLAGTQWRVVAVNGRDTPAQGQFSIAFTPDRLDARFGCNSIGAGYSYDGMTLDPTALITTEMACPDMSFESLGIAILSQPLRATWAGPRAVAFENSAGRLDLVRVN